MQKRNDVEREVIGYLCDTMKAAGSSANEVDDGTNIYTVETTNEVINAVLKVHASYINFRKVVGSIGLMRSVTVIRGHNGYDCLSNFSPSNKGIRGDDFSEVMSDVRRFVKKMQDSDLKQQTEAFQM